MINDDVDALREALIASDEAEYERKFWESFDADAAQDEKAHWNQFVTMQERLDFLKQLGNMSTEGARHE